MNELHLFAGAGGGILGGMLLGHTCVCAVEIEPYCRKVLLQRQRDGILPKFPIWDDVRTFDGKPWCGKVDVVCGGFPCQDISCAGTTNGSLGIDGERSGLWSEMRRIIGEVGPRFVLVENSPMLTSRGLGTVLGNLSDLGMDAKWGVISAANAGAPHIRERLWVFAYSRRIAWNPIQSTFDNLGNGRRDMQSQGGYRSETERFKDWLVSSLAPRVCPRSAADWWRTQSSVDRSTYELADRLDRLKAIGNGQVPAVVKLAWETLSQWFS